MKNLLVLLLLASLKSCTSHDNENKDIKLDSETKDTLEVIKRYPSNKIRQAIQYAENKPKSNVCFSEKGDTINFPRLIHIKQTHNLFLFVPISKNYSNVSLIFSSQDSAATEPIYTIDKIKYSIDIPVFTGMIDNKIIKGFIKCKTQECGYIFYPFKTTVD